MKRLIVLTDEGCEVPFLDLFDQVLRTEPFSLTKDDVLLLEGATADVNPVLYGDVAGPYLNQPDVERESREIIAIKRFRSAGAGILGICKGAQLACVFAGGSLIQHVTGHGGWLGHEITTVYECDEELIKMRTSSVHHQMMNPFFLNKKDYVLLAHSTKPLSDLYLDGKGEDLLLNHPDIRDERLKNFVEPEVIWFNNIRALAIQGHPEYMNKEETFVQWSRKLVERYFINA